MASPAATRKSQPSVDDELGDVVRGLIKLLILVVFLGTIMIWIVLPTKTFRQNWSLSIRAKAGRSTYFGAQEAYAVIQTLMGVTTLMYTFPILFIACMGCLYLHLKTKKNDSTSQRDVGKKDCLGVLKRPMLVRGPLGIVSGIELVLFVLFLALLVWSYSVYLKNGFETLSSQTAAKHGEKLWQSKLERAALLLGVTGNVCLAFLFYPVTRGSSLLPLIGLTSESSIKYHIWLGHVAMTIFSVHGFSFVIYWASTNQISQMLEWQKTGICHGAGELALLSGLILWATTFPGLRKKKFELFFYTHHLYILFVFFFVFHVSIFYALIMLPGFYLFMIDRYLRFLQSRDCVRVLSARVLPCDAVELNFAKDPRLSYTPTSTIFLNVPSISKLQWHPFTVTSSSNLEPEKMSVVIKSEGTWSAKLHNLLSSSPIDHLTVSVEGPYGPISTDFLRHESLVMVSGGSGITPFISIIRDLISASEMHKIQTSKITLICVFKSSSDLTMLDLILPMAGNPSEISNLRLQIEAYITREDEPSDHDASRNIRSIYLKPSLDDAPICPPLGPNSWLWLGAIIASSFVIFLILIGMITRYYIHPIDHNSNKIFPQSSSAVLNIMVICVSIALTASAAVFSNKKKHTMEAKQIQNIEGSPAPSPADKELESLPQQSLVEATNIHYGQRPDLKRILLETKDSSVGVLVCGPRKMRHEVAMICSSGLTENLHFESISFGW